MIRSLRPIFALFIRSLRLELRSKFPPIIRGLAVAFMLLLIWGNQRNFAYSAPGRTLLLMLAMVNLAGATVLGLGTFSSAITEEKEDETMGLLMMTRLNPLAILLGKSTARLVGGLLFVVVQIPFTMLCVTLGGVTVAQVLHVYAILIAYLAFLCNLCLFWSVVCRRTPRAVGLAFVTGLVLYLAPLIVSATWIGRAFYRGPGPGAFGWWEQAVIYLARANPVWETGRSIMDTSSMPGLFSTVGPVIQFHLIAAAGLFVLSWLLFDRFCSGGGEVAPQRVRRAAGLRRPRAWARAVAWKEFHFLGGGGRGILIRLGIYGVLVGALLAWIGGLEHLRRDVVGQTLRWCGFIIFVVELGSLAARIFGIERKRHTLSTLFTLPMGSARLIGQKISGCLPAFIPSVLLWWIGLAILWTSRDGQDYNRYSSRAHLVDTLLLCLYVAEVLFFAVLVAYLSLRLRRGPLLAGIGIMLFGNILFLIVVNLFARGESSGEGWLVVMTAFYCFASVGLGRAIPRRLAQCAAEE